MTARQTSIDAYHDHHASNAAACQQQLLLDALGNSSMTRRELSHASGIETSSVSGRVNEMIELGMVEECGKRKCYVTGRMVNVIRRVMPGAQGVLL